SLMQMVALPDGGHACGETLEGGLFSSPGKGFSATGAGQGGSGWDLPPAGDPQGFGDGGSLPSAVEIVDLLMRGAHRARASDIHLDPQRNAVAVRLRVDGVLKPMGFIPAALAGAVVSRIKVMANLDISERRLPQEGRFSVLLGDSPVDCRVSTLPSLFGEKVVLRLLEPRRGLRSVTELSLSRRNREFFQSLLEHRPGLVVVTGPTGSGKSTTLYAMMGHLAVASDSVTTLEDPVEYVLEGVTQVQINARAGLTFPGGLRAVLRQDPDIIMVGEIRDAETAELAVQAAMTGHLVLSTLHTGSAVGSIGRLLQMGVEPYMIAESLKGVVAQRLLRTVCPDCKETYVVSESEAVQCGVRRAAGRNAVRGRGCQLCHHSGYFGRMAVQEILLVTRDIQRLIMSAGINGCEEVESSALQAGMIPVLEDAVEKALLGYTTLEEIHRVLGPPAGRQPAGGASSEHEGLTA
ncbi:MAG: GspE/PulE family protein, partial [Syntrophomonadaceae bacterium]|nr:GspE/PulE family protein [Syntrophomonadaceae bacterium]